jgi:DNA-binding IclR family transcriptional regulator
LATVRETGDVGVTSHAVAKATGTAHSNTPRILKTLSDRGLVRASDTKPTIWTAVG